jgi:hypothetical protein
LLAGVRIDGIVFGAIQFDSGGGSAQVVDQLLAKIGGVGAPGTVGKEQS